MNLLNRRERGIAEAQSTTSSERRIRHTVCAPHPRQSA
jgi:hypothetical protein